MSVFVCIFYIFIPSRCLEMRMIKKQIAHGTKMESELIENILKSNS